MSEKSVRKYRPLETFWPYVEPPEELSVEEQKILTPDLQEVLFGPQKRPFSITVIFHKFESEDYEEAVALAKKSDDYWEGGQGISFHHRARYFPKRAEDLKRLYDIVCLYDCEVLVNDQAVPYARELWLPLLWFLIPRD